MASIHIRGAAEGRKVDLTLSRRELERVLSAEGRVEFVDGRDLRTEHGEPVAELIIRCGLGEAQLEQQ